MCETDRPESVEPDPRDAYPFRAACSGLWYASPAAAGSVSAVRVDGETIELERIPARIRELVAALADAIEEVEDWGGYASEYFQKKHDLAGRIEDLRTVLSGDRLTKPGDKQ